MGLGFQLKKNIQGEYILLEVAARMGGSSSMYRNKGINFALLSVLTLLNTMLLLLKTVIILN